MTMFEDREKSYENKFAHDAELEFRIHARSYKLLGLWAAKLMGFNEEQARHYALEVVNSTIEHHGEENIVQKIWLDLQKHGSQYAADLIRKELNHLSIIAKRQIMEEPY